MSSEPCVRVLTKESRACVFCNEATINELKFGKMYQRERITVHYYCLLFSRYVAQKGYDEQGILGFLKRDIMNGVKKGKEMACVHCTKTGATVECFKIGCGNKFHFPCGVSRGSLHLFLGDYKSYCYLHRSLQVVPDYVRDLDKKFICIICYETIDPAPSLTAIWAPCCRNNWFHRDCLQRLALSAGYFFKCPMCNNEDIFRKEMLNEGIYIPQQDASWELEPGAFEDLLQVHNMCDAEECLCPRGPKYNAKGTCWEIKLCHLCASQGTHISCSKICWRKKKWTCNICNPKQEQKLPTSLVQLSSNAKSNLSEINNGQNTSGELKISARRLSIDEMMDIQTESHNQKEPDCVSRSLSPFVVLSRLDERLVKQFSDEARVIQIDSETDTDNESDVSCSECSDDICVISDDDCSCNNIVAENDVTDVTTIDLRENKGNDNEQGSIIYLSDSDEDVVYVDTKMGAGDNTTLAVCKNTTINLTRGGQTISASLSDIRRTGLPKTVSDSVRNADRT